MTTLHDCSKASELKMIKLSTPQNYAMGKRLNVKHVRKEVTEEVILAKYTREETEIILTIPLAESHYPFQFKSFHFSIKMLFAIIINKVQSHS
jgi:hypothetical protein